MPATKLVNKRLLISFKKHCLTSVFFLIDRQGNPLQQACSTFLLVRATFTGEKLLRAICVFTKIKFQLIASFMYKIGVHFGQYFRNLSPKVGEDLKKGFCGKSDLILGKQRGKRL